MIVVVVVVRVIAMVVVGGLIADGGLERRFNLRHFNPEAGKRVL